MDDNDACELVEGYDPLKDFAERKPSWYFELEEDQPTDGIPMIVNSTELRSIVPAADLVEVSDGIWRLSRTAEEEALSWCR